MGIVYLIGAGPGDPALITVRGKELLAQADCILYDQLASPALLQLAPPHCETIFVGKRAGCHAVPQQEICRLLIEKASQHTVVVRLKGGDPFVFGRGGEELLALRQAGIDADVIPGVSAALAGPACAGIPLTHRGIATGFRVITAQTQHGTLPQLNFSELAHTRDTLVFLMSLARIEQLANKLLQAGAAAHTPCAVLSCATTPQSRTVCAPLSEIAAVVAKAQLSPPAMLVVGQAAALRNNLLGGVLYHRKILLPSLGGTQPLAQLLRAHGAQVYEMFVGQICARLPAELCDVLSQATHLVFTSKNGVQCFFDALHRAGRDTRSLHSCVIAAVGGATAASLHAYGIRPDIVPQQAGTNGLLAALRPVLAPTNTVVLARAAGLAHDAFAQALSQLCHIHTLAVYENIPLPQPQLPCTEIDSICFTSASCAERTLHALGIERLQSLHLFSIGAQTSAVLKQAQLTVHQAPQADFHSLAACVCAHARQHFEKELS